MVAASFAESARDATLGVRVHRRRGLHKDEELRIHEQHPSERESLALTAREAASTLLDVGVESVGERFKDVLGARLLDGGTDLGVAEPRVRCELVAERPGEEPRLDVAYDDASANLVEVEVLERNPAE